MSSVLNSRKLAVTVIGTMALIAAHVAKPAAQPASCLSPTIVGAHWIFVSDGANWTLKMEIAVKANGSAGEVQLEDDYDPEYFNFTASDRIQTGVDAPATEWGVGDIGQVPLTAKNKCGKSTLTLKATGKHAGWWGNQSYFSCADFLIVDNRGSGERLGSISPPGAVFGSKFRFLHPGATVRFISNPYPAAGGLLNLLAAAAKLPLAYHNSVEVGESWLLTKVNSLSDDCPASLFFVVGYSQGAQVAGDVVVPAYDNFGGVILFGDPYFNPKDAVDHGDFLKSAHGALGERPQSPFHSSYFMSYCHFGDPICQGKKWAATFGFREHKNYQSLGEPQQAAKHFTQLWG